MKITDREKEILKQLAHGKRPEDIAKNLELSTQTINNHIRWLRRLFEADTNNTLLYEACKQKII